MSKEQSLYTRLGSDLIAKVITEFYIRAFRDPFIGHFFFDRDRDHLTQHQIAFATAMLGGPKNYRGQPLADVHAPLPLRRPHFARRQVLMREVLVDMAVPKDLQDAWLALEERLKPLIVQDGSCHS